MPKFFNVKITQGVSDGPYDIYYTTTGSSTYQYSKLYGTNNNATLLTYSGLTTGDGVSVEVPLDVAKIVIFNLADDCEHEVTHYVITPTPTPTETLTPTPTITQTPRYYYYYLADCNRTHNKIGRSLTNGLYSIIYIGENNVCYEILGIDNGPYYDYDLDSLDTVSDCSDNSCVLPSTPTPTLTQTLTQTPTPTITPTLTITSSGCTLPHPTLTTVIVQCGSDFTGSSSQACSIKDMFNTYSGCTNPGGVSYWDLYRDSTGDPSIGDKFYNGADTCTVFSQLNGYVLMQGSTEYIIVHVSNGVVVEIVNC